ncbi:hypothetical protein DL96DRAFT_273003 [Flagelloscypha sp. PMI_526]|nr:hypothetical protein DL96DRAFT_273003 [Flagelloscypha sp. PMI_526]
MEASLRPISPFTNPRLKALFMLVHEEKDGRSVEQNTLLAFLRSTLTKDASSSHLHHFGEFARGLVFLGVLADADGVLDEDDGICYDDVKENASKDFEDIRKELYDIFSKDSPDCPSFLVHLRHLALPQDYSSHQRRGLRIIWRTIFYDFKWFTSGRDSDLTDPLQSQDTMEIDLDDDSSNSSEDEREEDYDGDTSNISQSQDSTMSDPDNVIISPTCCYCYS